MSNENRIYHLCRVVSPPELLNKPICVPSGWIQRRLLHNEVLVRYPTNELTTRAIKRVFNDENFSEAWMTIKAEELERANYSKCMEILTKSQQDLEDKVSRKRNHAQLEQGSSETIDEDDEVIFVSEKPAVKDSEASQEAVKIEQELPVEPTEAIETPRSRGEECARARTIQLSSVRDKSIDQQATEDTQEQSKEQDIASNQGPTENPNIKEPVGQPIRKKVRFDAINTTSPNLVITHAPAINIQQSSAHGEAMAQQATNTQNEDRLNAEDKKTNIRNEPEDQSLRKNILSEATKTAGLVVTCSPAKNIQLLSAYDDSIKQSEDQSNRLVVTLLPSINIQPSFILNKSMDQQVSNEQSDDQPYAQGITSKRGSTEEANRDASDRKLQRMTMKYFQFEQKMQEKLSQKRLKIENGFKKRNGAEDMLEKENYEIDDEEDDVDREEQSSKVKAPKGEKITPKKSCFPPGRIR